MKALHLCRRAVGSLRNHPVNDAELDVARSVLLPGELALWGRMQNRDQRHSLQVLGRFLRLYPHATREEQAAALLHDVGKAFSGLGWFGRIVATVAGPRTSRMAAYLDHEQIGNAALEGVSDRRTLEVLRGDDSDACVVALRRADDV